MPHKEVNYDISKEENNMENLEKINSEKCII